MALMTPRVISPISPDAQEEMPAKDRFADLGAELLVWGAIHNFPRLTYSPSEAIAAGQNYWDVFVQRAKSEQLQSAVERSRELP